MSNADVPRWPTSDPDRPTVPSRMPPAAYLPARKPRRRRRGPILVLGLALALVLAVLSVPAGLSFGWTSRTIAGTALPVATPAVVPGVDPTGSAPPTTRTSTTPPVQRILLLADHPLLASGVTLPEATCALPRFRRDTASLRAYYQAIVDCMDRTWQPVLAAGKMPHKPPKLNVAEHPGQTGCGDPDEDGELGDFTAMYCPADNTLYLPVDRLKQVDRGQAVSHLAVVAHEYSHHIQDQSGLLWAAAQEIDKVGKTSPQAQEVSRRTELQANCFAGLFIAAAAGRGGIGRSLAESAVAEFRNGALPQTHGSRTNQAAWARKGHQQRTTAACNTWAAPPNAVS